jgi:hypothetical protein
MHILKFAVPATILSVGLLVNTTASFAKPEFAKKEKKGCAFCHVKAGAKELNDAGKYYKEHKFSLEGYQAEKK